MLGGDQSTLDLMLIACSGASGFLPRALKKIVPLDLRNQALNLVLEKNMKQLSNDLRDIPRNPRRIGKFRAGGN